VDAGTGAARRGSVVGVSTGVEPIVLASVDELSITTLVDNVTDILLGDEGPARRPAIGSGPRVAAPVLDLGEAFGALRAEHGFAALVRLRRGDREHRILFDTGITPDGLVENMRRLELDPRDVEAIVLSHGHFDHVGGMQGLVRELGAANVPIVIHPAAWSRRRLALPGRQPVEIAAPSRGALEGAGFAIVERREPSFLLDGALLVTGEVDRTTPFERGLAPSHQACRHGAWEPDPLVLDDQALVADVRGRGLVVLTGCGHAGIVNTLRYVQRLTGREQLHAVVGGFHLNGPRFEPLIEPTCDAFAELAPDYLVPTHCTGWRATHALAARFPSAFLQNAVGTRFEFTAADDA
jgi:7,8-dihydropterin-6-yl-methyl-4-(beta-D-ribofuranosyl)aminobenzene 5'-phosphate synthase